MGYGISHFKRYGFETQMVMIDYGQTIEALTGVPTTSIIDREGYIVRGYLERPESVFGGPKALFVNFGTFKLSRH